MVMGERAERQRVFDQANRLTDEIYEEMPWSRPGRESPGMGPHRRQMTAKTIHERFVFKHIPEWRILEGPKPPTDVAAAFEDVFGKDRIFEVGSKRLHMALWFHPLLKRWTIVERTKIPGKGGDGFFDVKFWADENPPHDDYVPQDYRGTRMEYLAGRVGEYCAPTKQDFIDFERFDKLKYGPEVVAALHEKLDAEQQHEKDRVMDDWEYDFVDYYANSVIDIVNGGHMRVVATVPHKENRERYDIVDHPGGFRVRTRKKAAEPEQEIRDSHDLTRPLVKGREIMAKAGEIFKELRDQGVMKDEARRDAITGAEQWAEAEGLRRRSAPAEIIETSGMPTPSKSSTKQGATEKQSIG